MNLLLISLLLTVNGLLLCRDFIFVSPELKQIEKPKYKIYSVAHLRSVTLELLLISEQKVDAAFLLPA
jgi:hypothetical protein